MSRYLEFFLFAISLKLFSPRDERLAPHLAYRQCRLLPRSLGSRYPLWLLHLLLLVLAVRSFPESGGARVDGLYPGHVYHLHETSSGSCLNGNQALSVILN